MSAPDASPTLTHVAIHARDVTACVRFYQRYCGLVEVHRRVEHDVTVVWLGEPQRRRKFVIVLIGAPHEDAADPAPLAHLGYAVGSREEVDRLGALGDGEGILVEPPQDAGPIVGYFCILRDPEGNWVEFSHGQSLG
jgi:catechol 2,3-dioxygenase-like lactoylglutathione lyase family enzyme